MQIISTRRGYYVERASRLGLGLLAVALGVCWLLLTLPALLDGRFVIVALLATLALGIPAGFLASKSSRKRWKVVAVTSAQQVAGGLLLHVMDERQVSHQLLTDEQTAHGLASALTGRSAIEG